MSIKPVVISHAIFVLISILAGICVLTMPAWADTLDPPLLTGNQDTREISDEAASLLGNISLYFTPNAGQTDPAVLFLAKGRDFTIFYTGDQVIYSLPFETIGSDGRYTLVQRFTGANADPVVEGRDPLETRVSYFTGPEADWHTNIMPYGSIAYQDIYPRIDLVYRGLNGTIKREFLVQPGADPAAIRMEFDGADGISVMNDGSLVITAGTGELKESPPVCYQELDGVRVIVPCRFEIRDDKSIAFAIGQYDPSIPLMIDPTLTYCGYIGGSGNDLGYGMAVDSGGNAYISGPTSSVQPSFPVKAGPDLTYNGGVLDAFVAKVNAAGTSLVYCGYIGGSDHDKSYDIAVDSAGNAYVTGYLLSNQATFPVKVGPDLTHNGGVDAWVAKVNAAGTSLIYSGYIGGSGSDYGQGIAVDSAGNAYIMGSTASSPLTFPVKGGPDLTYNGGNEAFVAKVNAAGTALDYCGYIGGSGYDTGLDISVDGARNAYVTGYTDSAQSTFPVKAGPDLTYNGGTYDAFVAKVNTAGTALVYSGYIGGSGDDQGYGIAIDGSGNAYITGSTTSDQSTFPVKVGPDLTYNSGQYGDAFVTKVNTAGTALIYSGYIGGSGNDRGYGIAVDSSGNAYVTGETTSGQSTFPVKVGPDLTFNNGNFISDAFVSEVNSGGTALTYCGYIGGSSGDTGRGIAVDSAGNAYVTGYTGSDQSTFPVKGGPDLTYNVGNDAFIAKVSAETTNPIQGLSDLELSSGNITITPTIARPTDTVDIAAKITNIGLKDAETVLIKFYSIDTNNYRTQIGNDITVQKIPAGQTATVHATWTMEEGKFVRVFIDPQNSIEETNEDNNNATRMSIRIGEIIVRLAYVESDADIDNLVGYAKDMGAEGISVSFKDDDKGERFYSNPVAQQRLKAIINKAHNQSIKVYAWIPVFRDNITASNFTEWQTVNKNTGPSPDFISPVLSDARSFQLDNISTIVKEYKIIDGEKGIDGVRLDFCRYTDDWEDWSITSLQKFETNTENKSSTISQTNKDVWLSWINWRADQITSFVDDANKIIKTEDPGSDVGIYLLPFSVTNGKYQDNSQTGQDFEKIGPLGIKIMPMVYWQDWTSQSEFDYWVNKVLTNSNSLSGTKVTPVFSITLTIDEKNPGFWPSKTLTESQIKQYVARSSQIAQNNNIDKISLFYYRVWGVTEKERVLGGLSFHDKIIDGSPIAGDWNKDGNTEIGVFSPLKGRFYLDTTGNGRWNADETLYSFGLNGDLPVAGDWNKDGKTEIGVFRPSKQRFYLDTTGDGKWGLGDSQYAFGLNGDLPVAGDWNKDGKTEIGVFRPSKQRFYLDTTGDGKWGAGDSQYAFGLNGDLPVAGDWNKDGKIEIGVFRPSKQRFYLDTTGDGKWGIGDSHYAFGLNGDLPVAGDWNKDGKTEIGVFRPPQGRYYLDTTGGGTWGVGDTMYAF